MFFLMENIVNNAAQLIWVFVVIGMHWINAIAANYKPQEQIAVEWHLI